MVGMDGNAFASAVHRMSHMGMPTSEQGAASLRSFSSLVDFTTARASQGWTLAFCVHCVNPKDQGAASCNSCY
jgi:hypothetical protein